MNHLPSPTPPDYKTWPLEKLQLEYFNLRMKSIVQSMELADVRKELGVYSNFATALDELLALRADRAGEL